jgi:hypothetical protein
MIDDKIETQILERFNNIYEFLKFEKKYIVTRNEKYFVSRNYFKAVDMNHRQISNIVPEWLKDE